MPLGASRCPIEYFIVETGESRSPSIDRTQKRPATSRSDAPTASTAQRRAEPLAGCAVQRQSRLSPSAGKAGNGKTLMALTAALEKRSSGQRIYLRPSHRASVEQGHRLPARRHQSSSTRSCSPVRQPHPDPEPVRQPHRSKRSTTSCERKASSRRWPTSRPALLEDLLHHRQRGPAPTR